MEKLENIINYRFINKGMLKQALTHSSFCNENKLDTLDSNERLEFLGDAVLEIVVSEYIFNNFSSMTEGELTKLRASVVCEPMLAILARKILLGKYIKLGKGEEQGGGNDRDSILADAFEALIGAIFVDTGIESAKNFILEHIKSEISGMKNKFKQNDYKTFLQEHLAKTSKESLVYEIISESGPDHDKLFIVGVTHVNKELGKGEGKSKKEAEQNAALKAIENLKIKIQ